MHSKLVKIYKIMAIVFFCKTCYRDQVTSRFAVRRRDYFELEVLIWGLHESVTLGGYFCRKNWNFEFGLFAI